jgi:hypothetical protein
VTSSTKQARFDNLISGLADTPSGLDRFRGSRSERIEVTPEHAELLRAAEARIRLLRRDVEDRLSGAEVRRCAWCRRPVTGRPDRRYCTNTCRQMAYRQRAGMSPSG